MPMRLSSRLALLAAAALAGLLTATDSRSDPHSRLARTPIAISTVSKDQLEQTQLSIDVLSQLNAARTNPRGFAGAVRGARLRGMGSADINEAVGFLNGRGPLPPLTFSPALSDIAVRHAKDIGLAGLTSHTGSDGSTVGGRFRDRGVLATLTAEELSFGQSSGKNAIIQLIVDPGQSGRPHRNDLFNPLFTHVGVGCAKHVRLGGVCVINLSNTPMVRPPPGVRLADGELEPACKLGRMQAELDGFRTDYIRSLFANPPPILPSGAANANAWAYVESQRLAEERQGVLGLRPMQPAFDVSIGALSEGYRYCGPPPPLTYDFPPLPPPPPP